MLHRLILAFSLTSLLALSGQAQTVLVATPVADAQGYIAFQVNETLRLEGAWIKPPVKGQLIYPNKQQKAHPIGRFGESVIIKLPKPNDLYNWEVLHVHNGCIPALKGMPEGELIEQVSKIPLPVIKPIARGKLQPGAAGDREMGICPICKQRHIHL